MTVPQWSVFDLYNVRRIRTCVGFLPIEVRKSIGTGITVPYIGCAGIGKERHWKNAFSMPKRTPF